MAEATQSSKQLPILFLIVFINLVGFGVVLPVFPFFGELVNASPAETTLAMAVYSLAQFIGAPVWGKLSDTYGRRPILIASLIGAIFSYILMAHARDIWMLGISRAFGGLMAGNIAAALAYVGDITTPESRPKAMGMIGAAFGLGFIFGPAIGGVLAGNHPDLNDFAIVGYASAGITAVAAIAAYFLLPESLTKERRAAVAVAKSDLTFRDVLGKKPIVLVLMALTFLVFAAAGMMETTLAFFARDEFAWGPTYVGLGFAGVGIISAGLQGGAAGPLARRFGSGPLALFGTIAYAVGLAGLAVATSSIMMIAMLSIVAVGLGLFNPAFQTLTSEQTNDGDRGLVMGLTQGASSLGRVIGPAMSGALYQGLGHGSPFGIGAVIMVVAFGMAVLVVRKGKEAAWAV